MVDTMTSEEDILNYFRSSVVAPVFEVEVDDIEELPTSPDGLTLPYFVISFGGPIRAARGRGITGVRDDVMRSYVSVYCVAHDADALRELRRQAFDVLTGYIPENGSELIPEGGLAYGQGNTTIRPTRYMKFLVWTYRTNMKRPD